MALARHIVSNGRPAGSNRLSFVRMGGDDEDDRGSAAGSRDGPSPDDRHDRREDLEPLDGRQSKPVDVEASFDADFSCGVK